MNINIAKSAGFCFGVKRAIQLAVETAKTSGDKVVMLGDIVHNEYVVKTLDGLGIKKVEQLDEPKGRILLVRAHGEARAVYEKASALGYKIVDATCPMVKEIHSIAQKEEANGRAIIIIGDKNHDEVKGIAGQLDTKPIIIENTEDINANKEKLSSLERAAIVCQSTQQTEKVEAIVSRLNDLIKDAVFHNTICKPTLEKQKEIETLAKTNDCVIVIGSKTSANTRRLYDIAQKINPRTYLINDKSQIEPKWFDGAQNVGVSAGSSTPSELISEVVDAIQSYASN